VFHDILSVIRNNIEDELGDRSHSLFEESKSGLSIEYRDMLKTYHPDNHKNSNLQDITEALDKIQVMADPKGFLISGFVEYCSRVLERVGGILGAHPLEKILVDIEKVLGYVKKYQAGSREKNKIVNDMKNVIANIQSTTKASPKGRTRGGIFSLFS
jgi:hypothetical protein